MQSVCLLNCPLFFDVVGAMDQRAHRHHTQLILVCWHFDSSLAFAPHGASLSPLHVSINVPMWWGHHSYEYKQHSSSYYARSNYSRTCSTTEFIGELVPKQSFFVNLRIDCYLMIYLYLPIKERTSKGMEKALEAWRTSEDVRFKMEAQANSTSF